MICQFLSNKTFNHLFTHENISSMDNETAKRREEQKTNSETYIPTYVTSHDEETKQKEKAVKNLDEFEGDIWELADRSNKKYNSRYPRKEGDLDKIEL